MRGPATRADGRGIMLYYAYEHPWMIGSPEHTVYPRTFYAGLSVVSPFENCQRCLHKKVRIYL